MKDNFYQTDLFEFIESLKEEGLLDSPENMAVCFDMVTEPENEQLQNECKEILAPKILKSKLTGSPLNKAGREVFLEDGIVFGFTETGIPCCIDLEKEYLGLIGGRPNTGKTFLATFVICPQVINKGITTWIFTKAEDTLKLLKLVPQAKILVDDFTGKVKKNFIPAPPNVSQDLWDARHINAFIQSFTVFDGTENLLLIMLEELFADFKCKCKEYKPSYYDLCEKLESKYFPKGSREYDYRSSALNRLKPLLKGELGACFDVSDCYLKHLVDCNVIFDISILNYEQQRFFVNMLLLYLFEYKKANKVTKPHLCLVDDAMLILNRRS